MESSGTRGHERDDECAADGTRMSGDVYCAAMLPKVSRTFSMAISLLPRVLEHQVRCAYLLCRIADTIEDTLTLEVAQKQSLLRTFRASLENPDADLSDLSSAFVEPRTSEERLAHDAVVVHRVFHGFAPPQRDAIRPWVQEMCDGMAAFAGRFQRHAHGLASLGSLEELERYCYYVAGTVGHLLTELFRLGYARMKDSRYARLKELATSFGLGLQLTNIIKDVGDDRQRGWNYVPVQLCSQAGIDPEDLSDPAQASRANEVMGVLIAKARSHLDDALAYCCTLPRTAYRIRLFCLTPMYLAVRTLAVARRDPRLLDPSHSVKISRSAVYRTVAMAYLVAPSNALARSYYYRLAAGV